MRQNEKVGMVVATITDSKPNNSTLRTANQNVKGTFDFSQNVEELQPILCALCNPSLENSRAAAKFCPKCETERERTAQTFFENFKRHRRIYKLDCFCFACDSRKTSAMMAKLFPICRKCADELKTKGAVAQNNFISRATNNFLRGLKKAVTI